MKADRHAVKTIERRTACPIKRVYDTDFVRALQRGVFWWGKISRKIWRPITPQSFGPGQPGSQERWRLARRIFVPNFMRLAQTADFWWIFKNYKSVFCILFLFNWKVWLQARADLDVKVRWPTEVLSGIQGRSPGRESWDKVPRRWRVFAKTDVKRPNLQQYRQYIMRKYESIKPAQIPANWHGNPNLYGYYGYCCQSEGNS